MTGGHGVSLKTCSESITCMLSRKEKVSLTIVYIVHSLRNILQSRVVRRPRIYRWSDQLLIQASLCTDSSLYVMTLTTENVLTEKLVHPLSAGLHLKLYHSFSKCNVQTSYVVK